MYKRFEMLCEEKGITPYRVAKETGITTATLSNWKAGRYTPKADKLYRIAQYLGVSYQYLVGLTDIKDDLFEIVNTDAIAKTLPETDAVEKESTTKSENDAFYESLTDEQKAEANRLYQLFQKADSAHRLAVESLLRETPREP